MPIYSASKLKNRNNLLMKLAGSTWDASANTAVICSGTLLFSSRILHPSLVTLCSHKLGQCMLFIPMLVTTNVSHPYHVGMLY